MCDAPFGESEASATCSKASATAKGGEEEREPREDGGNIRDFRGLGWKLMTRRCLGEKEEEEGEEDLQRLKGKRGFTGEKNTAVLASIFSFPRSFSRDKVQPLEGPTY